MQSGAANLLSGPRGRRMCLEFALPQRGDETPEQGASSQLLFSAVFRLESEAGRSSLIFGTGTERPPSDPSVDEIASALENITLSKVDGSNLLNALTDSVDSALYWQEPDGTDNLLSEPRIVRALQGIADHIDRSPATSWLSGAMCSEQWTVTFLNHGFDRPAPVSTAGALRQWQTDQFDSERRAMIERPRDPTANWGGDWWSFPLCGLTKSTRALSGGEPVGLWLIEDSFGANHATVEKVLYPSSSRIFEIADAASWTELCRSYPLEVTASRRHDWYRTTSRHGRWIIPDWSRVACDYDAVHLTARAYLSAAGTAIPVDDDTASVIAGWNPDETFWLVDVSPDPTSRTHFAVDEQTGCWRTRHER